MPRNSIQVGPRTSAGTATVPTQPHIADVTGFVADDPVPVDVDGAIKAKVVLHYTSPASLGAGDRKFSGVVPHVQTASKTIDFDAFTFEGEAAEVVDKEILLDYPAVDETWTVYVCSKSDVYTNPLVLKGKTGETPNCDVMVSGGPFDMDAPDVLAFTAGTLDQTTGAWTPAMRWEPLKNKMLVDWGCMLPSDTLNWSAIALFIELPDGTFVQASDPVKEADFTQTADGTLYFSCVAIEGADIPATPTEWRFIACSYDHDGGPNHDGDGDPIGPVVRLTTLAPSAKPITDLGQVNLDTVTGSMPISHINNIGSVNITSFTGNLPISRVDNIGSINIGTFAGNLDVGKIANLGSFGIQNFEGVLVTQQLADGIMSDLNKFAKDFRPITKVSSLVALPNAAYPKDTVVLLTTDSTLHKAGDSAWTLVSPSDTITGKISDGDILSVNCGKLVGQIVAANVQNIRVDNLVGSLSVAQANMINLSSLNGNLDVSRVSNINTLSISNLSGNLDASRVSNLGSISITTFTGNLDASKVTNLSAISIGSLSGNLDVSRVSNLSTLSITTFSGTISTLNATTVTLTGQWADGQIGSLAASKLIAGTIQVGSGGMTFSGSGGISIAGTGDISTLVGRLKGAGADIISGGYGWTINGGSFATISGGSGSSINCGGYKYNGIPGRTAVHTFADDYGITHTLTFNGGLLTDWTT